MNFLMLMFHTPIHDDVQARLGGPFGGFLVYHPELHPDWSRLPL